MKVREIMTANVDTIESTVSIRSAAQLMAEKDDGVLPVVERDKVVGILTDRDIAVRGVAAGVSSDSPVSKIMTRNVQTCRSSDEVDEALGMMADAQIRRIPVCDEHGDLLGIVTLADAALLDRDRREVAAALSDICHPSGAHCQSVALYA
jgi:CBS domain-containing protein